MFRKSELGIAFYRKIQLVKGTHAVCIVDQSLIMYTNWGVEYIFGINLNDGYRLVNPLPSDITFFRSPDVKFDILGDNICYSHCTHVDGFDYVWARLSRIWNSGETDTGVFVFRHGGKNELIRTFSIAESSRPICIIGNIIVLFCGHGNGNGKGMYLLKTDGEHVNNLHIDW